MKEKLDFVTNSSSSSFIVAWPKKVEFIDEVKDIVLFTEKADIVYRDSINQKPFLIKNTDSCINRIAKIVRSGYFDGYFSHSKLPEYRELMNRRYQKKDISDDEYRKKINKIFNKADKENNKRAKEIAKKFVNNNIGKYAYVYKYSDNDGRLFCELEHGNTFDYIEHLVISHH